MSNVKAVCERCGQPAIVHVACEGASQPVIRHFCIACAELENKSARKQEEFIDHAAILIVVGLYVLLISAFADEIAFGGHKGFGWKQITGLLIAFVLVGVGGTVRVPTIVFIGLITGGLTIVADWVGYGSHPGFGWQQKAGSILGLGMMIAGLILARAKAGARRPASPAEPAGKSDPPKGAEVSTKGS